MARGRAAVEVRGLREFQAGLRAAEPKLARAMTKANKEIAQQVAARARNEATSNGGVQSKAAPAIVGAAEQRAAKIAVNAGRFPFANGAFYGALAYPQFDEWVGNSWDVGDASSGPAAINPAIAEMIPVIEDFYLDAFEDAVARAFPSELASLGSSVLGR